MAKSKETEAEVSEETSGSSSKNTHLEYVGVGREVKVRRITSADFNKMDVAEQGVVEFSRENMWKVQIGNESGQISAAAANALIERDSRNFKPAGA